MPEYKQYTYEEVKKSSGNSKTIIAIHDKVYDVTPFLNEHPGGEEILLDHGGKDSTEDFNDVGHSTDALELMVKFQIGEIVEAERRNAPKKDGWKSGYNSKNPENEKYVNGPGVPFSLLIGGLVLGVIAIFYLFH